jgi:pilus assembly protein Flp/PilA
MRLMIKFLRDDDGATAVEYGLIAGLIAVSIIAGLDGLSNSLNNTFNYLGDTIDSNSP